MAVMQRFQLRNFLLILIGMFFLASCSDPLVAKIAQQTPITEQRIQHLADALKNKQVRNAMLIEQYANTVEKLKPELSALTNEFRKDSGTNGPMFKSLQNRLETVKKQPALFANNQAIYNELINIYQAADPTLYSDALSDPLNVLADMSDGVLPRVNSLPKSQSQQANNAQDFGTGQQLIGNPSYGQWQTGSNGMSFWAWYGMYSLMGDIFNPRRTYYSDWGRSRDYSYYNDYGRTRYSSPSQLNTQNQLDERARKTFARKGQKFTSAYSKNKTGSSGLSNQSRSAQTSANKFRSTTQANKFASKSTYSKKSAYGKTSSFRNSSSSTSRGFSRGK